MNELMKLGFKKNCQISILESIIVAILGFILIFNPGGAIRLISYILGVVFIGVGIYKIINYLLTKEKYSFYNYDSIFGIMACIIGIITISFSAEIGSIFRVIIGIWILYTSIVRMSVSIKLKDLNLKVWTYSLILSIIMFCFGLFIIMNKGTIVMTIGIIMVIFSIIDIIEDVIFIKNIDKQ